MVHKTRIKNVINGERSQDIHTNKHLDELVTFVIMLSTKDFCFIPAAIASKLTERYDWL